MKNLCISCGIEFEAKRKTAKYCSSKCRKLAFQKSIISVPKVSVPVSVPPEGHCHGCGEKQENQNICICSGCIAKNVTHKSLGIPMCEVEDVSNYGDPNWKNKYKTIDEAKAGILGLVARAVSFGRFIAWGEYIVKDKANQV